MNWILITLTIFDHSPVEYFNEQVSSLLIHDTSGNCRAMDTELLSTILVE